MAILTTDEFRAFEQTSLGEIPLQTLLDAAEIEIVRFAGDPTTAVELVGGGAPLLALYRPAASITSVVETLISDGSSTTLDAADYYLHPGGIILERLHTGPNSRLDWPVRYRILVTYTPRDDAALRKVVQKELVSLALHATPGVQSETIGAWTEVFAQVLQDEKVRGAILGRLSYGPSMVVV